MAATPSPFASYKLSDRQEAARHELAEATENLRNLQERQENLHAATTDEDEQHFLREGLQGARAGVQNAKRYIKAGCPRVKGTL